MLSSFIDHTLARTSRAVARRALARPKTFRYVNTPAGAVRTLDSGGDQPAVVLVPDGPNVLEHYDHLTEKLAQHFRVVCFDMPGFGHSLPSFSYTHSLDAGANVVLNVMDALAVDRATLAFSCANGFYALRVAQRARHRVSRLVLSQTPSLEAMHAWVHRMIPRPLFIPVIGQIANWAMRKRASQRWYRHALAEETREPWFGEVCSTAFSSGACFCLASVVQAMMKESPETLSISDTPCTLIWGTQDRSHSATEPESIRMHAANAEIIRYDQTGHFPDLERVDRFIRVLVDS